MIEHMLEVLYLDVTIMAAADAVLSSLTKYLEISQWTCIVVNLDPYWCECFTFVYACITHLHSGFHIMQH